MSTTAQGVRPGRIAGRTPRSIAARARAYFFSDAKRAVQTVLGLIWLLDGGLQFQAFMYGRGFIQFLTNLTVGQPHWVSSSVTWGATTLHSHQTVFNTAFALVQIAIGVGLLYRPTVRPALVASFGWALVVWWFGEAFGMMFMATTPMGGIPMASALTGAPGAVLLYALIGAMVWPNERPAGLLGVRGARAVWAALWLVLAWLWLVEAGGANGVTNAINAAPSGMSWLTSVQDWFAHAAKGDGAAIGIVLAAVSATIGVAVAANWRPKPFLALAVGLNLLYWVVGQGFGGIPQGGATDPNAGLLFVVLAYVMYTLTPYGTATDAVDESRPVIPQEVAGMRIPGRKIGARRGVAMLVSGALLAGCAAADKTTSTAGSSASSGQSSSGGMSGMNMGSSSSAAAPAVDGIRPVPTQTLASATWQGMKIKAMAMTAVPFVIVTGTSETMVKPTRHTSFHLMVMLNDDQTGVPIPYASVWATISKAGKVVYDERQWPMISRYMGPHYGNDVELPGGGTYQLSLLISPPLSARHVEYQDVWQKPHRVTLDFHWKPVT